jgi:hypothetical protein
MTLNLRELIILLTSGLLAVTFIDVVGSITSRPLNYKYVYLTPISFLVYGSLGFWGQDIASLTWTLIIACLIGVYDGTIGWKLSIILRANFGDKEEHTKNLAMSSRISGMIIMSGVFGLIGYVVAGLITKSL